MIKEYVDAWFRNRDKLKKYFETHTQEQYGQNYTDMLKTIIKVIINDPEEILDETRIIERDLTDYYQGDYIWLIKLGDDLGWNIDNGYIDLRFSSQLATDGTPCLVIDYGYGPRYDFRNLM